MHTNTYQLPHLVLRRANGARQYCPLWAPVRRASARAIVLTVPTRGTMPPKRQAAQRRGAGGRNA